MEDFGGNMRINEMKTIIFISLSFSLLLSSCDTYWFNIIVDENGFKKSLNFECGKIDVSGNVLSDRQISTFINFKIDSPIIINPEKINIRYKGEEVDYYDIYLNEVPLKEIRTVNKDSDIRIIISPTVKNGDTVKINIDNFILCKGQSLGIGDINLIVVSRK